MTSLLAIDPGACTGYALFQKYAEGRWALVNAGAYPPDRRVFLEPYTVVIESPQIYPNSKARPADILTLARIVGRYQERYDSSEQVLVSPHEWKGSVNGDIMIARIESALNRTEIEIAARADLPKSKYHNMIDAIGIGKWALRQPFARKL